MANSTESFQCGKTTESSLPSDLESVLQVLSNVVEAKAQHDTMAIGHSNAFTMSMDDAITKLRSEVAIECVAQNDLRKNLESLLLVEKEKNNQALKKERKETKSLAKSLSLVSKERDVAVRQLHDEREERREVDSKLATVTDEMDKLRKQLSTMHFVHFDLIDKLAEERDDKYKMQELLGDGLAKRRKLEEEKTVISAENATLQAQLKTSEEERASLKASQASLQKNLDEEMQKTVCHICLSTPKDTIILPCLHLIFCFKCLDEHRKQSSVCPKCRGPLNGVLRCYIDML